MHAVYSSLRPSPPSNKPTTTKSDETSKEALVAATGSDFMIPISIFVNLFYNLPFFDMFVAPMKLFFGKSNYHLCPPFALMFCRGSIITSWYSITPKRSNRAPIKPATTPDRSIFDRFVSITPRLLRLPSLMKSVCEETVRKAESCKA
uniref:Uncharacterized protein n=1 Tax=Glossina austeni TaxID=7395 RepID=A0A1A9UPJ1_GLOAU